MTRRSHNPQVQEDAAEEWRSVPGYEGLYSVSNFGQVRGERRTVPGKLGSTRTLPQKLMALNFDSHGYYQVSLRKDEARQTYKVAYLVALAFIGLRPEGMEVAHGDGTRDNNHVRNLRYDTPTGNAADRLQHGTDCRGEKSNRAKLTTAQVLAIRNDARSQRAIAAQYGVSHRVVWGIKHKEGWAWL